MRHKMQDPYEIFKKMTKEQIIKWIRQNTWMISTNHLPKESGILFQKWSDAVDVHERALNEHIAQGERIRQTNWEHEHNRQIDLLNNTKDYSERAKIFEKIVKLRKPWDLHLEEYKKVAELGSKADKIYEQYNNAIKNEQST